jgi:hypothetical protein
MDDKYLKAILNGQVSVADLVVALTNSVEHLINKVCGLEEKVEKLVEQNKKRIEN